MRRKKYLWRKLFHCLLWFLSSRTTLRKSNRKHSTGIQNLSIVIILL